MVGYQHVQKFQLGQLEPAGRQQALSQGYLEDQVSRSGWSNPNNKSPGSTGGLDGQEFQLGQLDPAGHQQALSQGYLEDQV